MELEDMIRKVVEEVMAHEKMHLPGARLIGRDPGEDLGYRYVEKEPFDAVVIGSLSARELLFFPDEVTMDALLHGKPVLLWEGGLDHRRYKDTCNGALYSRLLSAERQMKQLGVKVIGDQSHRILTANEVRRRMEAGQPITGRLTPLARDLLEGKES